jgi:hypothetical protein
MKRQSVTVTRIEHVIDRRGSRLVFTIALLIGTAAGVAVGAGVALLAAGQVLPGLGALGAAAGAVVGVLDLLARRRRRVLDDANIAGVIEQWAKEMTP